MPHGPHEHGAEVVSGDATRAAPRGFAVVVGTPAPLDGAGGDLIEVLRPIVRHARGAVLMRSSALAPGQVYVAAWDPAARTDRAIGSRPSGTGAGGITAPSWWLHAVTDPADAEALADWLAIGGPVAPFPSALDGLVAGWAHARTAGAKHDRTS